MATDPNVIPDNKSGGGTSTVRTTTKVYADSPATPVAADYSQHVQSLLVAMGGATNRVVAATTEAGAKAEEAAGAAARATAEEGQVKASERDKQVEVNQWMGTSKDDIAPMLMRAAQAQRTMDNIRPQLEAQSNINPLEDPLGWVAAHFTRPVLAQAYNNANNLRRDTQQQMDIKQRATAIQQQIDLAPVGDLMRQASADRAAAVALEGIQKNKDYLAKAASAKLQAINEEMGMRQSSAQMTIAAMRMGVDLLQISQSDKDMAELAPTLALVNGKRKMAGMDPIIGARFKLLSPVEKNDLLKWGELPNGAYGSSLGHAYSSLEEQGAGATLAQADPAVSRFFNDVINSSDAAAIRKQLTIGAERDPKFLAMSAGQQVATVFDAVGAKWDKEHAGMLKTGDSALSKDNPYRFKPKDAVLVPELANNMVTKMVVDQMGRDMNIEVTPKMIVDMVKAQALVNMDKPGYVDKLTQDAADFYRKGVIAKWVRGGQMRAGVKNPSATGYAIAGVEDGENPRVLQTWNPADWMHAITSARSTSREPINLFTAVAGAVSLPDTSGLEQGIVGILAPSTKPPTSRSGASYQR